MIDHILGRPSPRWKSLQVALVLLFWTATLLKGPRDGPNIGLLQRLTVRLRRLSPWQLIVTVLTGTYAAKNMQHLLGLNAPEPLSRLYSRNYYRATFVATSLDAGFATAMHIRPKPLRDFLSVAFAGYYLLFHDDADEKLRKYRALCSVEMLRATWHKTDNPLIRFATARYRPPVKIQRRLELIRPPGSRYTRPITVWLYFDGSEAELRKADELVVDIPGGGFIAMSPIHHEERLLRWAKRLRRPILSLDYSKAPEHPYPYAVNEVVDLYRLLVETQGAVVGMRGEQAIKMVWTGDSAGANIGTAALYQLLETLSPEQQAHLPVGLVLIYPALSFNLSAWMPREDLRVLKQEESTAHLSAIAEEKAHLSHRTPLSVVGDDRKAARSLRRRTKSWSRSLRSKGLTMTSATPIANGKKSSPKFSVGSESGEEEDSDPEEEQALAERVKTPLLPEGDVGSDGTLDPRAPLTTRLTMSSRTCVALRLLQLAICDISRSSYFGDRIIAPTMMRAMALLYVGPSPLDLSTNYYVSPLLAPPSVLARLPRLHIICGERDPLVDDSIIFAGKVREARRQAGLAESDDLHRVTLRLVEGWSHGFLQMISLLPGVGAHLDALADEILDAFSRAPSSSNVPAPAMTQGNGKPLTDSPKALQASATPPLVGFVETADLLRRRREEAVEGITETPPPEKQEKRIPPVPQTPRTPGGELSGIDGFSL